MLSAKTPQNVDGVENFSAKYGIERLKAPTFSRSVYNFVIAN
jgi:hypothetical protein